MHSIILVGVGLVIGTGLGWYLKGKFGTGVAALEADAKKL